MLALNIRVMAGAYSNEENAAGDSPAYIRLRNRMTLGRRHYTVGHVARGVKGE